MSFKYSIREEYLTISSDVQYILFPISTDILACQVSNGQFVILTLQYIQQILQVPATMPFSSRQRLNK